MQVRCRGCCCSPPSSPTSLWHTTLNAAISFVIKPLSLVEGIHLWLWADLSAADGRSHEGESFMSNHKAVVYYNETASRSIKQHKDIPWGFTNGCGCLRASAVIEWLLRAPRELCLNKILPTLWAMCLKITLLLLLLIYSGTKYQTQFLKDAKQVIDPSTISCFPEVTLEMMWGRLLLVHLDSWLLDCFEIGSHLT